MLLRFLKVVLSLIAAAAPFAIAQNSDSSGAAATGNAEQVAEILGVSGMVAEIRTMQANAPCGTPATLNELSLRQTVYETIVASSLDVDGVLAELDNERAQLGELSSRLQARRDRSVNIANIANLITGTGVGIGVNALQFSSSTANVGNSLGVGSGIGSTLLSIVGIRRQRGPQASVGRVPNMLAPLFDRPPKLNAYYPPEVLNYLRSVPAGEGTNAHSRVEQLFAEWQQTGRISPDKSPQGEKKIRLLTSSSDQEKLSIDDLSDRIAMLGDVTGKVGLMKRDLARLVMSVRRDTACRAR